MCLAALLTAGLAFPGLAAAEVDDFTSCPLRFDLPPREPLMSAVQGMSDVELGGSEEIAPWIPIIGVVACDLAIHACNSDAYQEWTDCASSSVCSSGQTTDGDCCDQRLSSDLFNCLITCGVNGPDGDYGQCCQDGGGVISVPTP